jgi:hypothetical protein
MKTPLPKINTIPKGIYQHYKGQKYKLIDFARHSESLEAMVIYQALYGDHGIWVRPLDMFIENVEINGVSKARFQLLEEI